MLLPYAALLVYAASLVVFVVTLWRLRGEFPLNMNGPLDWAIYIALATLPLFNTLVAFFILLAWSDARRPN